MNSRIHGSNVLKRRTNIENKKNYKEYIPELKEDFNGICGYCGKLYKISKASYEPDHFVPKKYSKAKINDYTNLVYSCMVCNRKKGGKWPTENPDICHDGKCGFIDPTTKDFDLHLQRNSDGTISAKTELGQYMVDVFQFEHRPMKEIFQAMLLYQQITEIKNSGYIPKDLYDELEKLTDQFFDMHE